MSLKKILSSGFVFTDDEYELKLQYYMHNAILNIVVIVLSILTIIRFFQENYIQFSIEIIIIIVSVLALFYIKKSKKHINKITSLLLAIFFLLISFSFFYTNMYLVGTSWFIVLLLPSFYLAGIRVGVIITVASVIFIIFLGQIAENGYSIFDYFQVLMPIVMASIFIVLYEKRVEAVKNLLNLKYISLEKRVNAKTQEESLLLQNNRELADVISKSNIELYIVDFETDHYLYVNKGGLNALGYTLSEMLDLSVYDTNPTLTVEMVERMKKMSETMNNIMNITQHQRKDGSSYGVQSLIHAMTYHGKKAYVIYDINLSDQQKAQDSLLKQKEELLQKAHYDELTKLPNRTLFNDRLTQAIAKSNRYKTELAILFIDLDKFKEINDTYGHKVGDSVLCEVSLRFTQALREIDTVSRFGGDEFVCIIEQLESIQKPAILAQKLMDAIKKPIEVDNLELSLTCSIGISLYPTDALNPTKLLHHADSAMYRAKDSGRDRYKFYL